MSKITISKGLKIKNRLAGEIASLQGQITRENSGKVDRKTKVDMGELCTKHDKVLEQLVNLKASLNRASAPIAIKLVEIAEQKGLIPFYQNIPTKEGKEMESQGFRAEPVEVEYEAFLDRVKTQKAIEMTQEKINKLQDEIDEFNAQTFLDIEL